MSLFVIIVQLSWVMVADWFIYFNFVVMPCNVGR